MFLPSRYHISFQKHGEEVASSSVVTIQSLIQPREGRDWIAFTLVVDMMTISGSGIAGGYLGRWYDLTITESMNVVAIHFLLWPSNDRYSGVYLLLLWFMGRNYSFTKTEPFQLHFRVLPVLPDTVYTGSIIIRIRLVQDHKSILLGPFEFMEDELQCNSLTILETGNGFESRVLGMIASLSQSFTFNNSTFTQKCKLDHASFIREHVELTYHLNSLIEPPSHTVYLLSDANYLIHVSLLPLEKIHLRLSFLGHYVTSFPLSHSPVVTSLSFQLLNKTCYQNELCSISIRGRSGANWLVLDPKNLQIHVMNERTHLTFAVRQASSEIIISFTPEYCSKNNTSLVVCYNNGANCTSKPFLVGLRSLIHAYHLDCLVTDRSTFADQTIISEENGLIHPHLLTKYWFILKFLESEYVENQDGMNSLTFSSVVNVTIQYVEKTTHTFVIVVVFHRNNL